MLKEDLSHRFLPFSNDDLRGSVDYPRIIQWIQDMGYECYTSDNHPCSFFFEDNDQAVIFKLAWSY